MAFLGAVPNHWKIRRLGQIGTLLKGNGGTKDDQVPAGVPCVRYGELYTTHRYVISKCRSYVAPDRALAYTPIAYGDVLFAGSGETIAEIGRSAVNLIRSEAVCGGDIIIFRPALAIDPYFAGYAMDCWSAIAQKACMGRGITVKHIYSEELKRLAIALPPVTEQRAIGRFLDYVDRRLQRVIRAKQKLISLLEEQRQAVIWRAVTGRCDADVPVRPSGVKWLPPVPEHWRVLPLRRLVSFVTSGSRGWAEFYSDSGDVFVQSGNLGRSMALDLSYVQHVRIPDGAEGARTRVRRDDLLVCITGALTGNVVLVDVNLPAAYVNQHVALVRLGRQHLSPRFIAYCLHSVIGQDQFGATEYGGTKQGLGLDDIKSVMLAIPPLSEQKKIVAALDRDTANIRRAVESASREIALVRAYRSRLVADVTTGKVDVRELAAGLPSERHELATRAGVESPTPDESEHHADYPSELEEVEA